MTPIKKYTARFWGRRRTVRPMLLDTVFGDGAEWIWFEHLDDRPDYYIARVPTGTLTKTGCPEIISDVEDAIRDEASDYFSARAWREYERDGWPEQHRRWPIPPRLACGSAWGSYTPPPHVRALAKNRKPKTKNRKTKS
jgi:hypothetical protein